MDPRPTQLPTVMDRCLKQIQRRYTLPPDAVNVTWAMSNPDKPVITDAVAVEVVLQNLIDNAIKYSNPGDVHVDICVAEAPRDKLEIEVRDQGMGLTPRQAKRVFKRFYRVKTEGRSSVRGTGLGLYVVRNLVERREEALRR